MKRKVLTSKQKKWLKAQAHALHPVVQVGKQGISAIWLQQLENALNKRELLKVNLLPTSPLTASQVTETIETALPVIVLQKVGRILTLYQQSADKKNRYYSEQLKLVR